MKVFISWSGETSRQIADALRGWLPMVIQAVKPYMSQRDNDAGVRWEGKVSTELALSNFGILCLTPDNRESAWLNFEAGALGKAIDDEARVVPLLYKLEPTDVARPLGMFMAKKLDDEGVKETLEAINNSLDADRRLEPEALEGAFTAMWELLRKKLARVEEQDTSGEPEPREERDILTEILQTVRTMASRSSGIGVSESLGTTAIGSLLSTDDPVNLLRRAVGPDGLIALAPGLVEVTLPYDLLDEDDTHLILGIKQLLELRGVSFDLVDKGTRASLASSSQSSA